MQKIESVGTYIGKITSSAVAFTKAGKPRAVIEFLAVRKYVEDKAEIEHFRTAGVLPDDKPAYVDWNFDQGITAYLLLFNSASEFNADKGSPNYNATFNYENLRNAVGWTGETFDELNTGAFVGQEVMFKVKEKEPYTDPETGKTYGGDGTMEVAWIDSKDASPVRLLKPATDDEIKAANAKIRVAKAKPAAAVAPPAAARPTLPPSPSPAAPAVAVRSTPTLPAAAITTASTASASPASKAPPKRKSTKGAASSASASEPAALPAETDQATAWADLHKHKGTADDARVADAWIAASGEVGEDDAKFTPADWAKVRDGAIRRLDDQAEFAALPSAV